MSDPYLTRSISEICAPVSANTEPERLQRLGDLGETDRSRASRHAAMVGNVKRKHEKQRKRSGSKWTHATKPNVGWR